VVRACPHDDPQDRGVADFFSSLVDPKGEHAKMTYWRRTSSGVAVGQCLFTSVHFFGNERPRAYKLDPFKQEPSIPSSHYNPLSEVDLDDLRVLERLAAISDGCVLPEGEKNQHFVEGSRTILEGVIAHVLSREPAENRHLPYVHDLLLGFDRENGVADLTRFEALLMAMRENPVAGGICLKAANYIAHDTRGNMMTTVLRSIKWMGDPAMREHLSAPSDFKFADVPEYGHSAGNTVYIVAPIGELMKEQVRWLRVLTNLSITIIRLCPKPARRTLFILDEFPQLRGKLSAVEEGIVTLRSAHIRLWPFIQQIGQLKKDYPANWNMFISSSNVLTFGVTDPETAQWVSDDMLGATLHVRKEGKRKFNEGPRPLLSAREVMTELGKNEPLAIVFPNDGGFPMRVERMAYKPLIIEGKQFLGLLLDGCFEEQGSD
jgi:type IV secretion system protein VirD4